MVLVALWRFQVSVNSTSLTLQFDYSEVQNAQIAKLHIFGTPTIQFLIRHLFDGPMVCGLWSLDNVGVIGLQ